MSRPDRLSRNAEVDFRGKKRSNATHASTTEPDARLYRKFERVRSRFFLTMAPNILAGLPQLLAA
jgi:hypothetical protein